MRSIFYFFYLACLLIHLVFSYDTKNGAFTEIIGNLTIPVHFEKLIVHHDLYTGIGNGSLPLATFKSFVQQDHLYVHHYFRFFRLLINRETNSDRIKYLQSLLNDEASWEELFNGFYEQFEFEKTTQMTPATLDYAGKQHLVASYDDLGVALAAAAPCFFVWAKIGAHWRTLRNGSGQNPYRKFVELTAAEYPQHEFRDFIDGYYANLNGSNPKELAIKQRMIDAYIESVELEYRFASALIDSTPFDSNSKNFTDLTPLISPEIQKQVVEHPLYDEIARGISPIETFKTLIQQDYLYMRGFYAAFEYMERKEPNLDRKTPLRKNGKEIYDYFENEFKNFNFGPAVVTAPYNLEYIQHETSIARDRSVGEGMASIYPCYFLWLEFGIRMNEIADTVPFSPHPYQAFLDSVNQTNNEPSVNKAKKVLNYYYENASLEEKYRMLQIIRQGILHELHFADGVYGQRYYF